MNGTRRTRALFFVAIAAILSALGIFASAPSANASTCPTYQFIGVRGSGETNSDGEGYGVPVNAMRKSLATRISGGDATFINYPAIPVNIADPHYRDNYRLSINAGMNTLSSFISSFHTRCGSTPIVLAGYSQGAHVVGDVYQSVNQGTRDKTTLVMFGDPRFNPAQPQVNFGNFSSARHGIWTAWFNHGNASRTFSSGQYSSVRSYCLLYDPVCNYTAGNGFNCRPNAYCVHTRYIDFGYTDDAAKWAEGRVRGMMPAAAPVQQPTPAAARSYVYHVANTGGSGLRVRPSPAAVGAPLYGIPEGGTLSITCQVHGQRVLSGSDIWDRLTDGGWVYDWYTTTPNIGAFSPPIPVC